MSDAPTPHPIKNQVLVRRDPCLEKLGLIYTPDGSQAWPETGTVVAVGPSAWGDYPEDGVAPGARVQFKSRPSSALFPDDREDKHHPWLGLVMLLDEDVQMELAPAEGA